MTSLPEIVLRSAAVYTALYLAFRFLGKRELAQFTAFDFVLILLLADSVQNAMVGGDESLAGGLTAAATLIGLHLATSRLLVWKQSWQPVVEGKPTVLVRQGRMLGAAMRKEGVETETLQAAIREQGVARLADVQLAVLELDGRISIIPKPGRR